MSRIKKYISACNIASGPSQKICNVIYGPTVGGQITGHGCLSQPMLLSHNTIAFRSITVRASKPGTQSKS